jgi:hypothetical protein
MNEWTFIRHPDATWSWLNVQSDHVSGSFHHFNSLEQAADDAAEHGFDPDVSRVMHVQHERRIRPRSGTRHQGMS